MKWTKKTPNKQGYYWYREDSTSKPVILLVQKSNGGWHAHDEEYCFEIEKDGCEWCYVPEPQ